NGFDIYTSSLGISRWKDLNQVNDCGIRMGEQEGVPFWDYNWRKKGGCQKMLDVNKEEHFYKQEYCGCVYSLRDSNKWREENGREKIKIAKKENTY
ncbi:MAG: epoxyqueuosine reductase QueH, partial [Psittacicella sp.]